MDWNAELYDLGLVALAGLLGCVIGLEREFADKPAGLRTHCIVAAAAALLTILGQQLVERFIADNPQQVLNADPVRIIHAIVLGIGFLGAGTIVRDGTAGVGGLTTAASILLSSGVGIAVAISSFVLAIGTSVGAVLVLVAFRYINQRIDAMRRRK